MIIKKLCQPNFFLVGIKLIILILKNSQSKLAWTRSLSCRKLKVTILSNTNTKVKYEKYEIIFAIWQQKSKWFNPIQTYKHIKKKIYNVFFIKFIDFIIFFKFSF